MSNGYVFISHATADDDFVYQLRQGLEGEGIRVWADSRRLRGGDKLEPAIREAIAEARHFIVVLSPMTINSPWVRWEIQQALEVEQQRHAEGYRVIPLLLPGVAPAALPTWFEAEPAAIPVAREVGGVSEALSQILAALGEQLPNDIEAPLEVETQPLEELILELQDPVIQTEGGTRRVEATATLVYRPADMGAREVRSTRFTFTAPLGPIETDELRWYLEAYALWPTGVFKTRAERIEGQLPLWGRQLYQATLGTPAAREALRGWQNAAHGTERRFSVLVDNALVRQNDATQSETAREAAVELLALPWELLHDQRTYWFEGQQAVRVRRRLPNRYVQHTRVMELPIRILLVSPRPEDDRTGYIDHRISALPLVQAVENLGELVELSVLTPPTFAALGEALERAAQAGNPFDVVHFDGHGVYDRRYGLGQLCFEDPDGLQKLQKRHVELVNAQDMAGVMHDSRIPLVFLEACQTAVAEDDPRASVAAKLLEEGVTSVVAMSHSVLVETARRFVEAFYGELARGARVGQAMLAGQKALKRDTWRGRIMGAGELRLEDWFVPVLYQEEHDPQLFNTRRSAEAQRLHLRQRALRLGALPEPPPHSFVGRSRTLLALERLLAVEPYAVIVGPGGTGKTALAVELARWLVRTERFARAAFVSLETYIDDRGVVDSLGRQLLPEGDHWSVAQFDDLRQALQPIERALRDDPTIVVLDNLESVLPDATGTRPPGATPIDELLSLCQGLLDASPSTRLVFTSREGLPAPFDHQRRWVRLGTLSRSEAIALVGHVLSQTGLAPAMGDAGDSQQEIEELVESVNCHPRALVLLAREVSQRGVRASTHELRQLMRELYVKHPGDRENSLYASVELSLRRLSPGVREQVASLAVFHGGANVMIWRRMLEVTVDSVWQIARELIHVGLAEAPQNIHLPLDPALPAYLLSELKAPELDHWHQRWGDEMQSLCDYLYHQRFRNVEVASHLTVLELPNLLEWLIWLQAHKPPEDMVIQTTMVERLLVNIARPWALAKVVKILEEVTQGLDVWDHTRFRAESANVERLLERGDLQGALGAAKRLLQNCLEAGESAYSGVPYDIAFAYGLLGQILKSSGAIRAALPFIDEQQRRFEALAEAGNKMLRVWRA